MPDTLARTMPSPVALIDALNDTFGKHAGKRASHAKGFCAAGLFVPAPAAPDFADSPLFRSGGMPAVVRFSVGGGNPNVSDKSRSARGMGVRLQAAGEKYDLVLLSEPAFFAATPESFVSFLQARVADPETKKPDPARIAAHNAAYPDGMRQPALLAAHAAPESFATTPYFSNNAFVFEGSDGTRRTARIVVEPLAGTRYLSEDAEKNLPDHFLEDELSTRLRWGVVAFTLFAQLPAPGDSLTDSSTVWAGTERVALGTLTVTGVAVADSCDGLSFVPTNLPKAVTLSDDPILQSRAAAYAVSLKRRS